MGDSACLVHAFSYTSAIPSEPKQGNPMHGLGESVSLGRFMSESLAWEKWSTFSHNRYVEEAERYAQPGSVAQKKAFFEAHYKRIAAKKAAALLEQANHAASTTQPPETQTENVIHYDTISDSQPPTSNSSHVAQAFHEQPPPEEQPHVQSEDSNKDFMATDGAECDNVQNPNPEEIFSPAATDVEPKAPLGIRLKFPEILKNQETFSGSDEPQLEKPLLQQGQNLSSDQDAPSVQSKKKSAFSSLKSSVYRKTSKVPCSPAKPITPRIKKESSANYATTPITKKKQALDFTEKKRSIPKSVNTFVNSTPVKQLSNLLTPSRPRTTRKMDNCRIVPDSSKRSQNCTTPLGTRNMEPSAKMSKDASAATPCSANTRTKTPADGNKTAGPKWHMLSAVCSKSLTACRNKLQSPTLSTPFILRTEERAARRKQKLEEKFNSKDIEKVQPQTSLKEKAESELRKLRPSFCFKARPLPDFYKEREAQNDQMKKNPVTKPQSPKLGRKLSSRTMQATVAQSSKTLNKNGIFKHDSKKNGLPASSLPEMTNHENASPNIQH